MQLTLAPFRVQFDDVSPERAASFGKRLALWVLISTVAEANGQRDGDKDEARAWMDKEGREWLRMMGLEHAATLPIDELLDVDTKALARALATEDPHRHCRNCAYLQCSGGSCRCEIGCFEGTYSAHTVYHDGAHVFVCENFAEADEVTKAQNRPAQKRRTVRVTAAIPFLSMEVG